MILLRAQYNKDLGILQCVSTATIKGSTVKSANVIVTETRNLAYHGNL